SAPFDTALDVVGEIEIVLDVKVDTPDADIFAELYDVSSDGTPALIHLSRLRLRYRSSYSAPKLMTPEAVETVVVRLPAFGWRVLPQHRLELRLAGAECGYSENPNTGGSIADETMTKTATVTVLTGPAHPSRVRLPTPSP